MRRALFIPVLAYALAALAASAACAGCEGEPASPGGPGGAGPSTTSATVTTGAGGAVTDEVPYCNRGPKIKICNPFGLRLDSPTTSTEAHWDLVTGALGLHFYRPAALALDQFAKDPAACAECDAAAAHGLYLTLVVRNNGGPGAPAIPPADLSVYRSSLSAVLDRYRDALAFVVIEEEPTSALTYAGSAADYLDQLTAGCAAAHDAHLRCANGGIGSTPLLFALAHYYWTSGFAGEALRILRTAKSHPDVPQVFKDGAAAAADADAFFTSHQAEIDHARAILAGLRGAGVDYANFHFYEEDQDTLDEAIAFVRMSSGCNAMATDELGLRFNDAFTAAHQLGDAKEYGLSFVIWSAASSGVAAPLTDAQGNLLANGATLQTLSTTATCDD